MANDKVNRQYYACIQLHRPQGHPAHIRRRRRLFSLLSTTFWCGYILALPVAVPAPPEVHAPMMTVLLMWMAWVCDVCVCVCLTQTDESLETPNKVQYNNWIKQLFAGIYESERICVMWGCSLPESAPDQRVQIPVKVCTTTHCVGYLIFIGELVGAQCIRWEPMSTIFMFVYSPWTINNLFEWNLFNIATKRERSIPTDPTFSSFFFLSFFHFPSFFSSFDSLPTKRRLTVGTWNEDKIFSSHRKHKTLTAISHTHTSSGWQISLEIAYVIIASFGWIYLFCFHMTSKVSCRMLDLQSSKLRVFNSAAQLHFLFFFAFQLLCMRFG